MIQEAIDNETNIENTNKENISIEAGVDEKLHDIREEMPSGSGVFEYPKLDEFLGNSELRPSVLCEVEFVNGKFGETVALLLKDTWYRSSSKPIIDEAHFIKDHDLFPCRVFVAEKKSETGRTYYTLRGGEDE